MPTRIHIRNSEMLPFAIEIINFICLMNPAHEKPPAIFRRSLTEPSGSVGELHSGQSGVPASGEFPRDIILVYNSIKQLASRLQNVLREGGLGIPSRQIMNLQGRLVECYHQAIAFQNQYLFKGRERAPSLPFIERIEYTLYKDAFRIIVKYYRNEVASMDTSEHVLKRRLNDAFINFLTSSIQTF